MGTYRMGDRIPRHPSSIPFSVHMITRTFIWLEAARFPTVGTANPTITLSALALRTADSIVDDFKRM